MTSAERKKYILNTAMRDGMVSIPGVAEYFGVSVETIRRDVNALCNEHRLSKIHGGAVPTEKQKKAKATEDSRSPGAYAASLIESGDIVMFDTGEEAQAVAAEVAGVRGVTLITNSVNVASVLMKRHAAGEYSGRIILIGGELDPKFSFSRSPDALTQLGRLKATKAFITALGVTADGASSDGTYESSFSAAMIEHSKKAILICTSEKIGKDSLARFAPLSAFSCIITDNKKPLPEKILSEVEKNGVEIKTVGIK